MLTGSGAAHACLQAKAMLAATGELPPQWLDVTDAVRFMVKLDGPPPAGARDGCCVLRPPPADGADDVKGVCREARVCRGCGRPPGWHPLCCRRDIRVNMQRNRQSQACSIL